MTDEMNSLPQEPIPTDHSAEQKAMRRCYSRCGWAVFAVTAAMFVISFLLVAAVGVMEQMGFSAVWFYNKYLLVINEALIAVSVLIGMLVLLRLPKFEIEKRAITPKGFFTFLLICFAIGTAGNTIGNTWLGIWNTITGNDVTNQLVEVLMETAPWQIILCTAILAPVLEEFFFRKLLIDRMYRFGELPAILASAILFGLFHQNFSQFFYAFGIGAVLAYLYCRTGSYFIVTLMHAAFNFISGVLPSLLSMELNDLIALLDKVSETELIEMIPTLAAEYAVPLVLLVFYFMLMGIANISGIVLFFFQIKKIHLDKGEFSLTAAEKRKAAIKNAGMIAAGIILILLMIVSLFPA